MAALNKLVENEVDTDEKREMLASVGLIMPHLETTLARFEEAGLGKYVLPEVQKKYMLRGSFISSKVLRMSRFGQAHREDSTGEGLGHRGLGRLFRVKSHSHLHHFISFSFHCHSISILFQ